MLSATPARVKVSPDHDLLNCSVPAVSRLERRFRHLRLIRDIWSETRLGQLTFPRRLVVPFSPHVSVSSTVFGRDSPGVLTSTVMCF